MQIAILLYPRFTALDVVGPYDVLSHLPGASTVLVAPSAGPVGNEVGSLSLMASASLDEVTRPDVVVVPGGPGWHLLPSDGPECSWLRSVDAHTTWTASVCTGSLVLAAAGFLQGRRATTHWLAVGELAALGVTTVDSERVVVDGKYVTSAGVSAGIDMAFTLAGKIAGDAVAASIALAHEYAPQPPYPADSVPQELRAALVARRDRIVY